MVSAAAELASAAELATALENMPNVGLVSVSTDSAPDPLNQQWAVRRWLVTFLSDLGPLPPFGFDAGNVQLVGLDPSLGQTPAALRGCRDRYPVLHQQRHAS